MYLGAKEGESKAQITHMSKPTGTRVLLELSFLHPLVLFPLSQTRSSMATQEINLFIDLPEALGM